MDKFVTRKSAEKPKDSEEEVKIPAPAKKSKKANTKQPKKPVEPSSQQSSSFSYEDLENQLDGS